MHAQHICIHADRVYVKVLLFHGCTTRTWLGGTRSEEACKQDTPHQPLVPKLTGIICWLQYFKGANFTCLPHLPFAADVHSAYDWSNSVLYSSPQQAMTTIIMMPASGVQGDTGPIRRFLRAVPYRYLCEVSQSAREIWSVYGCVFWLMMKQDVQVMPLFV